MKIIKVAGSAGFCAGVKRSVDMAEKLVSEKENCCSYGEIIHNADVVGDLESRGLKVVREIGPELKGKSVIIRSGVSELKEGSVFKKGYATRPRAILTLWVAGA